MSEWISATVNDVTSYQKAGGTPTATNSAFYGGDIPFVTIEDITNSSRYLEGTEKHLSHKGLLASAAWVIKDPHILYSMYATVGKPIINHISCATNQAIIALKENNEVVQDYLYYQLLFIRPQVHKYTAQTTQSNLNAGTVRKLPVSYPKSKKVQKKIATILSTIDTAIEKTEALIAKYQQIKAGLMHDLFTRGVLPNGQLRPSHEQAPELYQETALGWIPKGWKALQIKNIVTKAEYGISESLTDITSGIPVLRMNNIQDGCFDVKDMKYAHSTDAYRLRLKVDDVLYNRTNSMEHVGKAARWLEELPECSFASYLVRLNLDSDRVRSDFLTYWLNQVSTQQALRRFATPAVQQVNINPTNLQRVLIAIPMDLEEQAEVTSIISGVDKKIDCEKLTLTKLVHQKQGLMQDLLTGKVPVSVEEPVIGS